ncbi:hypothetical protein KKF91_07300 [Myxococcota bacterium]|nr:hypothetical protein [Myxococcota bacterium]MBU1430358.1 hypothetical protein [Myxococcota bacterium]MBU1898180.1 hypothetical protein [Myxococcota bacterium]
MSHHAPLRSKIALLLLGALCLPGAKSGCGSSESNETLTSPVQGVFTILERADGRVDAELVLINTGKAKGFIDGATEVAVRVPGGDKVTLELTSPGHYTADSELAAALTYAAGETYQVRFELSGEEAGDREGGDFIAVTEAPDLEPAFEIASAPEFAGDTAKLTWTPAAYFGLISIYDAGGALVWRNFDFQTPDFDGSKWARLKRASYDLGVDVFKDAGEYTVEVCVVNKVSDFDTTLSADLGALSGFLIGRCAPPKALSVAE